MGTVRIVINVVNGVVQQPPPGVANRLDQTVVWTVNNPTGSGITFAEPPVVFPNPAQSTHNAKNFHHTWNLHVGGEYAITQNFLARLGFMYDPTPSPSETLSPDLPDADRLNFAGGVGYRAGGFTADLGYQYVLFLNTGSTFPPFPGTMSGGVHVVGLTLGYALKM